MSVWPSFSTLAIRDSGDAQAMSVRCLRTTVGSLMISPHHQSRRQRADWVQPVQDLVTAPVVPVGGASTLQVLSRIEAPPVTEHVLALDLVQLIQQLCGGLGMVALPSRGRWQCTASIVI